MKILIVEDEKISQQKMKVIMSKFGICDVIGNGAIAIEMFQNAWRAKAPFDLVTLDITLHEMSGLDVLATIREFEQKEKIPPAMRTKVMMVSSHSDQDSVLTSATCGAEDYVIKPFTSESISLSLRKIYLTHIQDFLSVD